MRRLFKRGKKKKLQIVKDDTVMKLKGIVEMPNFIYNISVADYDNSIRIRIGYNVDREQYLYVQKNRLNKFLMEELFDEVTDWIIQIVPYARYQRCQEQMYGPVIDIYYLVGEMK